jgi:hypothetical protein
MLKIKIEGDLRKIVDRELNNQINIEIPKIATVVSNALTQATPKDTGEASQGWTVVYNLPENSFSLDNQVEHIGVLNTGHSKQAPAYFIERVVLNFGIPEGNVVNYR